MTTSRPAGATVASEGPAVMVARYLDVAWPRLLRWWNAQSTRTKLALAVAALFAAASLLNMTAAGLGRAMTVRGPASQAATSAQSGAAPTVTLEAGPTDPAKVWAVTKVWQGSGGRETEQFTVGAHWRVDWLFSPTKPGDTMQVFIYSADGRLLLNLATNTQRSGADTSFWAGPGTYFLKVNATGDWKLDVQDLR